MKNAVVNGPESVEIQSFLVPFGHRSHDSRWLIAYNVIDQLEFDWFELIVKGILFSMFNIARHEESGRR
jgi:hypothetical protein